MTTEEHIRRIQQAVEEGDLNALIRWRYMPDEAASYERDAVNVVGVSGLLSALTKSRADKYIRQNPNVPMMDVYAECMATVARCLEHYTPDTATFTTYYTTALERALGDFVRLEKDGPISQNEDQKRRFILGIEARLMSQLQTNDVPKALIRAAFEREWTGTGGWPLDRPERVPFYREVDYGDGEETVGADSEGVGLWGDATPNPRDDGTAEILAELDLAGDLSEGQLEAVANALHGKWGVEGISADGRLSAEIRAVVANALLHINRAPEAMHGLYLYRHAGCRCLICKAAKAAEYRETRD